MLTCFVLLALVALTFLLLILVLKTLVRPRGHFVGVAPTGAAEAAAPEGGAFPCPSALTPTSSCWALVNL
jgi:hypothetical protein